jgi:hypothetical protein
MQEKSSQPSNGNVYAELKKTDWEFTSVPDSELVACCVWEYARESSFIRETLKLYREIFQAGSAAEAKLADEVYRRMDRIQSIADISTVIISGCSFPADAKWQSSDTRKSNYRHPDAPYLTGSFPTPWQNLCQEERNSRALKAHQGSSLRPPALERGCWSEARDIGRHCEAKLDETLAAHRVIQRQHPRTSEVQLIAEGKLLPFRETSPSLFWESGRETTILRIAWGDYTNDQLAQDFRRWVRDHRPTRVPVPSRRGHKTGDWRARLTRLAAMRILSKLTPAQISAGQHKLAAEIADSKQFQRIKWLDTTKWHDARREAGEIFSQLFPFLGGEKPRSWLRPTPGK